MKKTDSNSLAKTLQGFFGDYLPDLRGMSPHTILSYRDSIKLFLQFLSGEKKKSVLKLNIDDIGTEEVIAFLKYIETTRRNVAGTRNIRLSAIHSFFRYFAEIHPEYLNKSQLILNIPFKRTASRPVDYLEFEEISAVLESIDRSDIYGKRDYAILSMMFNTGARVQEIVDIKGSDLQLISPFCVNLHGKGDKYRICPLWPQTAEVLREYVEEWGIDIRKSVTVFTNHLGTSLTRFGIRYILAKYLRLAAASRPSLNKKRLHPHCMRHSTAVHLLKSGVDLCTISHWLGHCSPNTTNRYVTIDLEMKRKAIEKANIPNGKISTNSSWKKNPDILKWLESL